MRGYFVNFYKSLTKKSTRGGVVLSQRYASRLRQLGSRSVVYRREQRARRCPEPEALRRSHLLGPELLGRVREGRAGLLRGGYDRVQARYEWSGPGGDRGSGRDLRAFDTLSRST